VVSHGCFGAIARASESTSPASSTTTSPRSPIRSKPAARLHKTLLNKWYLDEIYDFIFINGLAKGGGRCWAHSTAMSWIGALTAPAGSRVSRRLASMWWDTWIIDGAVRPQLIPVKVAFLPVRILQTGQVQSYALFIVVGAIVFFGYYMVGR
jgi:NADH-quinone oxidoreductase subunit L